jgi:hypothetical protein
LPPLAASVILAAVDEATLQRVGSALRRMGEDLVAERRRVMILTRENEQLRAQLEELRRAAAGAVAGASGDAASPAVSGGGPGPPP